MSAAAIIIIINGVQTKLSDIENCGLESLPQGKIDAILDAMKVVDERVQDAAAEAGV